VENLNYIYAKKWPHRQMHGVRKYLNKLLPFIVDFLGKLRQKKQDLSGITWKNG
jgi:hypothetical protein